MSAFLEHGLNVGWFLLFMAAAVTFVFVIAEGLITVGLGVLSWFQVGRRQP